MPSATRSTPVDSPEPRALLGTVPEPDATPAPTTRRQSRTGEETRGGRLRRKARRTRLHGYAIAAVALVAYLIALAVSNTAHVKVSWVFGHSHISLVWLVLFTAILGWLLGLATSSRFRWRTRAPRRGTGQSS
jgi:uncharacterized integral membrane protein